MCTEFLLALIYLITLFLVNFIITKVLSTYLQKIYLLQKIKSIFVLYKNKNLSIISFLFLAQQDLQKYNKILIESISKNFYTEEDILILGNIYKFLSNVNKTKNTNFFFDLLSLQYFPGNKK